MSETATTNLNLYQKLAKIRMIADVAAKDKRGFNYSYADITQILAKVTAGMNKYGVSLIPGIVHESFDVQKVEIRNTKVNKKGETYEDISTEMLVSADMEFTWVNNDDPSETIVVPWVMTGSQSDPSQATGSGLTYCTRYFLTNYFQIAQKDVQDVDEYRSKQKEAEMAEKKAIAASIIEEFDLLMKKFLPDNQDKVEDVKKFISKYVKGGNYFNIKEPEVAAKLLNDFKVTYIREEN